MPPFKKADISTGYYTLMNLVLYTGQFVRVILSRNAELPRFGPMHAERAEEYFLMAFNPPRVDSWNGRRGILRQFFMTVFALFTARFTSAKGIDFTELTL
jgi:hypothetical protein